MKRSNIVNLVLCGLFTALIAAGAFMKIPIPAVPFTLQFLFTMLAGLLLGSRLGALSVLVYMLLGLIGLPIFAQGGGPGYIFVPSFGYIPGFIVGTFVTGLIVEKQKELKFSKILFANFVGLMIVYAIGMLYYYLIGNYVVDSPIGLWPLFLYCFLLAVPGDIVLCFLGAFLAKQLIPIKRRMVEPSGLQRGKCGEMESGNK